MAVTHDQFGMPVIVPDEDGWQRRTADFARKNPFISIGEFETNPIARSLPESILSGGSLRDAFGMPKVGGGSGGGGFGGWWGAGGGGGAAGHVSTPYGTFNYDDLNQLPKSLGDWVRNISSNMVIPEGGPSYAPPTLTPEEIASLRKLPQFEMRGMLGKSPTVSVNPIADSLRGLFRTGLPGLSSATAPSLIELATTAAGGGTGGASTTSAGGGGGGGGGQPPTGAPQNQSWLGGLLGGLGGLFGIGGGSSSGGGGIPFLSNLFGNPSLTGLPRGLEQIGGVAALLAGLQDQPSVDIPNYGDFASPEGRASSTYLRGAFESPADPFAAGGVYEKYLPLIQQQENALLDNIQARAAAGMPGSLSARMGGGELADIRGAAASELLPRRHALFADLTRENMARQLQAALGLGGQERLGQYAGFNAALSAAQQAAEAERNRNAQLAQLGVSLLLGGGGGGGTTINNQVGVGGGSPAGGGGVGSQVGGAIDKFLGGLPSNFGMPAQIGQMTGAQLASAVQGIGGLFFQTPNGPMPIGIEEAQQLAAQGYGSQIVTKGGEAAGTSASGAGGVMSLLGKLATIAGGTALAFNAQNIGQNQAQSALVGAAGGAIAGSQFGPVGTAIGAIAGGLKGLFGKRAQQHEQKEAFRKSDLDSQSDQVQEIGAFFNQRLKALGVDTASFDAEISRLISASPGPGDEQGDAARLGGRTLLAAIQKVDPSVTALSQVPGLREEFVDYLTRSTFTSGNSAYGGGPPLNFIGAPNIGAGGPVTSWREMAGLRRGGHLPRGGVALVGEAGPELLVAGPGTSVIPLLSGVN